MKNERNQDVFAQMAKIVKPQREYCWINKRGGGLTFYATSIDNAIEVLQNEYHINANYEDICLNN